MFSNIGHPHLLCLSCKFEIENLGPVCIPGASNVPHTSNVDFTGPKAFCCQYLGPQVCPCQSIQAALTKSHFMNVYVLIPYLSMYKTIFF